MSQTSNSTTNSIDDTEYTVEAILAVRFVGVQAQFLVKWVDIELDETNDDNWLHALALKDCAEELIEFWQRPICKKDIKVHKTI